MTEPVRAWPDVLAAFLFVLLGLAAGRPAEAHFLLNINIRIVHVEHLDDGLRVIMRLPTPYVVAGLVGPERADGSRDPAPYTRNAMENGQLMHYVDLDALHADPTGLGRLVADGHRMVIGAAEVRAEVESVRLHPGVRQPPFASLDEARQAFRQPLYARDQPDPYVGDTVLDVMLRYRHEGPSGRYAFSSTLDPSLEGQDNTANLIIDHFPGGSRVFRATGLLHEAVVVDRSALAAARTFVGEGIRHILEGADHVLFVICLALGASAVPSLLWRVTGFTIGHSITLAAGFFGLVPSADWFVPAVESGIALSIVYAALIAMIMRESRSTLLVTAAIGLLHGLGFSFVLSEILHLDSPYVWPSLVAFNVGVEIGQVAIVLAVWPLFRLLSRYRPALAPGVRGAVAVTCMGIAAVWFGQRAVLLLRAVAT
jgi:hypothetical protein